MNALYKSEVRKKRSKFTTDQLDTQQVLVTRLHNEIEKVKELHMTTYRPVQGREEAALRLNTQTLDGLESTNFDTGEFSFRYKYPLRITTISNSHPTQNTIQCTGSQWANTSSTSTGGGVALSNSQAQQLSIIQSRDEEFDMQLETIGEGLQDLSEIAKMQNEEVRRQNAMLETVGSKIIEANDHITNVNQRMKETLAEVRGADKICVDIMCVVLIIGLSAVLYKLVT